MAVLFQRQGPAGAATSAAGRGGRVPAAIGAAGLVEKIIEQRLVTAEFQPIVRLPHGEVVAFEALARGPADSPLSSPSAMFRAAETIGAAAELDQIAHVAAFNAVMHTPRADGLTYFVNVHPAAREKAPPEDVAEVLERAPRELRIVTELAEHELITDPVRAIVAAVRMRALGVHVALDNLGSPEALPLLPLLQPDVIKLDPSLLMVPSRQKMARIVDALAQYTDETNALIIGQGIERPDQLFTVIGTGAELGQGYQFGPPVTVPTLPATVKEPAEFRARYAEPDATLSPYDMLRAERTPTLMESTFMQALAAHYEERAENCGEPFVMFVVSPTGKPVSGLSHTRLRGLGRKASLLVALSPDADLFGGRELRVGHLPVTDPMASDLTLAVLTPTCGTVLAARPAADEDDRFDCLVVHDRSCVIGVCRSLLARYLKLEEK